MLPDSREYVRPTPMHDSFQLEIDRAEEFYKDMPEWDQEDPNKPPERCLDIARLLRDGLVSFEVFGGDVIQIFVSNSQSGDTFRVVLQVTKNFEGKKDTTPTTGGNTIDMTGRADLWTIWSRRLCPNSTKKP